MDPELLRHLQALYNLQHPASLPNTLGTDEDAIRARLAGNPPPANAALRSAINEGQYENSGWIDEARVRRDLSSPSNAHRLPTVNVVTLPPMNLPSAGFPDGYAPVPMNYGWWDQHRDPGPSKESVRLSAMKALLRSEIHRGRKQH